MKTIIFDMDGLMFDTEKTWLKCFKKIMKELGYKPSNKLHNKTIGTNKETMKEVLKKELGNNFPFENFYEKYITLMEKETQNGVKPKKGLKKLLKYLVKNNYLIAIASSSDKKKIEKYLKANNINPNIFEKIVSGKDIKKGKPNPDIFIKTCKLLKAKKENTIVLEDSNNGIKAAYYAGCIPILIPDINIITKETKKLAKYEFDSLLKVINFLEKNK